MTFTIIMLVIFAYLLGSIPFGLIFVRTFISMDLRRIGSGNIGATNARRAGGWVMGIATLVCDVLKGAIPVYIAAFVFRENELQGVWIALTALSAFSGHLFPVYLKFKTGGKGVATAAGCFAVISPMALTVSVAAFLVAVIVSRRVSAGSITAAALLPVGIFIFNPSPPAIGCALVITIAVIYKHKDNIMRLRDGTEPRIR